MTTDGTPPIHLSVLPWSHAFGLVLDLLVPLRAGAEIVRDPAQGREVDGLTSLARSHPVTHFNTVPLLLEKIRAQEYWQKTLPQLRGGIVGGAPISAPLAEALRSTNLRVGYGLTEASPGLMLGEPGEFSSHFLGRPVECRVRLGEHGELFFQGDNASLGWWSSTGAQCSDVDDWRGTGDQVREEAGAYWLVGRCDHRIKLPNGTWLPVPELEQAFLSAESNLRQLAFVPIADGFVGYYCLREDKPAPLLTEHSAEILAPWKHYLKNFAQLSSPDWPYTPKGETDRSALCLR
jgi:acyl-CoA synthetase (AMP-forming)/AMP-acid ligase II